MNEIAGYLTIILTVIAFYLRTLWYSIIVDDIQIYGMFKRGHYRFNKKEFKSESIINKIRRIISFIKSRLYGGCTFGSNTIYDHAFSIFLHSVTCVLIYILFGSNTMSWMAAMLYAVNPFNDQTAIWINGRRYQIAVILGCLALIVKPIGPLFYLMSLSFQMTTFFLPVFALDSHPWALVFLIPLILMNIPRIQRSYHARMKRIMNNDQKTWGIKRITVVIKSYGFYFFKMIFPGLTMMNYPTLIEWGVKDKGNKDAYSFNMDFYKGLIALVLTGGIAYFPQLRLISLFIFLGILQWSAIICAFQQLADRYMSMVNVFMMFVVVYLAHLTGYQWFIFIGLFTYYATQLNVTMQMYKTIDKFFEYQLFWHPEMVRNSIIYADSYLAVQDVTRAWMLVERALHYDPDDFELLLRAAQCSACVGMVDKAKVFIDTARKNFYVGQKELQEKRLQSLEAQISKIKQQMEKRIIV